MTKEIDVAAAQSLLESGATFVDIRDPDAYRAGHIPGAAHVHDGNVAAFLAQAPKDQPMVVYCYHGNSSKAGADHFAGQGFDAASLIGGFTAWSKANAPSETGAPPAKVPAVSVSPKAKEQIQGFMADESEGTRVRITLEAGGRFGLALDEARDGVDLAFEVDGLGFAIDRGLAAAADGLKLGWADGEGGFLIEGGNPPRPAGPTREDMRAEIERLVKDNKVVIFMKGTAASPMCGFSARATQILQSLGKPFADKNALVHPEYRYVLSEFSDWPTLPQVFVNGKLVGGSDIVMQMHESGDLAKLVDEAFATASA